MARRAGPGIALASAVVVAGHVATLLLAARTAGAISPILQLLPLAVLVLLATAVPTNIGGWGPREGAAAWAFGAAGLGAAQGVAPRPSMVSCRWRRSRRRRPCSSPLGCAGVARHIEPEGGAVADRPYTVLSCAMSIDGYIAGDEEPLPLSNGPTSIASMLSGPAVTPS